MAHYKLLTFDIWDTVLLRYCHPDEVKLNTARMLLLTKCGSIAPEHRGLIKLFRARLACEVELGNRARLQSHDDEYRIDEVLGLWLEKVLTSPPDADSRAVLADKLMRYELETEKRVSFLDRAAVSRLERISHDRARFVSDFYMPAGMIEEVLRHHGFDFAYEAGHASCDAKLNKRSSRLFAEVHRQCAVAAADHIHVGDSQVADVQAARRLGINVRPYRNRGDRRRKADLDVSFQRRLEEQCAQQHVQALQAKLEREVVAPRAYSAEQRESFRFGVTISPIYVAFVLFIIEQTLQSGLDQIHYFTREGELLKRIHDRIVENDPFGLPLPRATVLEVSRMATFAASLREISVRELRRFWTMYPVHSLATLFRSFDFDPAPFLPLIRRYGLTLEEVLQQPWELPRFLALMADAAFRREMLAQSAGKREALEAYLEQHGISNERGGTLSVADLGWRGTIQDNLAIVLTKCHLNGYYFALYRFLNPQPANMCKAAFGPNENQNHAGLEHFRAQSAVEMMFNSPLGSVTGYRLEGGTVAAQRELDESENRVYEQYTQFLQAGVLASIPVICAAVRLHALMSDDFRAHTLHLLERVSTRPPRFLAKAYFELNHNEVFGNGVFVSRKQQLHCLQLLLLPFSSASRQKVIKEIRDSGWKEAYLTNFRMHYLYRLWFVANRIPGLVAAGARHVIRLPYNLLRLARIMWAVYRKVRAAGFVRSLKKLEGYIASSRSLLPDRSDLARSLWSVYRVRLDDPALVDFNHNASSARVMPVHRPLSVNWVIPDFSRASGGHMTIVRFARFFESVGIKNRFYVLSKSAFGTSEQLKTFVDTHYPPTKDAEFHLSSGSLADADITFATSWETAYRVFEASDTRFKAYLIQDFEPYFYPAGSYHQFAKNTYLMNFFGVCASRWLHHIATERFGMRATYFNLGFEPERYYFDPDSERNPNQIAVYLRPHTERRGLEMLIGALSNLSQTRPRTRIVIFGTETIPYRDLPFSYEVRGQLDEDGLRKLYNESTLCLLSSFTNYSLLPNEVLACGCLVVDIDVESTRFEFADAAPIVLAKPDPWSIAAVARHYLDSPAHREETLRRAAAYLADKKWTIVFQRFMNDLMEAYLGRSLGHPVGLADGDLIRARGLAGVYRVEGGVKRLLQGESLIGVLETGRIRDMPANELLGIRNGDPVDR